MRYRHKKRGSVYEIITPGAKLQCSTNPEIERFFEEAAFTVYRNVENGATYIRPTAEFFDGRFEVLEPRMMPDDGGLKEPVRSFDETFSAQTAIMERFFPDRSKP